jgi:hypothetical protein
VELRELLDGGDRPVEDVVVGGARKAASGGDEVFEHHHERVVAVVERRVPHARNAHRQLVADRRVELRLGHAEADHAQELTLLGDERLELHEQRVGDGRGRGQPDTRPPGRTRVGVDHLDGGDGCRKHRAEPRRREVRDLRRDRHDTSRADDVGISFEQPSCFHSGG